MGYKEFKWCLLSPADGYEERICKYPEKEYPEFEDKIVLLYNTAIRTNNFDGQFDLPLLGEDGHIVLFKRNDQDSKWIEKRRYTAGEQFP